MTQPTLLPIYSFARVLGLHPLHVMGVAVDIGSAASRVCVNAIQQYSWQDADGVSREELAGAIAEAELQIANELGYWPAPTWAVDERVDLAQRPGAWYGSMYDVRGDYMSVKASRGLLLSGGRRSKDLIQTGVAVVYSDADSDGYSETATISVATTVTDSEEIAVYYPGLSGDDEWEVRPITVSIAAGVATITCRREQLVKKELYERLDATVVDGATASNFLTTIDVYRKYNDPSVQAQLVWRSGSCCSDGTCGSCGLDIQNACMVVKDKILGLVTVSPGEWNGTGFDYAYPDVCSRRPDYVRLWYRSGYQDRSQLNYDTQMARQMQQAVAKLAISKLDRLICSCKAVSDVQSHWSTDLRRNRSTRGESSAFKLTQYEMDNNPFGTTVAALEVWRLVRRMSTGL
jgi:hypothetical protein